MTRMLLQARCAFAFFCACLLVGLLGVRYRRVVSWPKPALRAEASSCGRRPESDSMVAGFAESAVGSAGTGTFEKRRGGFLSWWVVVFSNELFTLRQTTTLSKVDLYFSAHARTPVVAGLTLSHRMFARVVE